MSDGYRWVLGRDRGEGAYLSLGAGVQSSTLLLMMSAGQIEPVDAALFADTQSEPPAVYKYLDYLRSVSTIPIHVCSAGSLMDELERSMETQSRSSNPPFFALKADGSVAPLTRDCTVDYKVAPLRRTTRSLMRQAGHRRAIFVIGISLDEAVRMKDSRVKYLRNEYPLVDMRMTRQDCLLWLERNGHPEPPKSACLFCPYTSDARWHDLRNNDPQTFASAVEFDRRLTQHGLRGTTGSLHTHRSCRPLDVATDDGGQMDLFSNAFINECDGLCGV